MLLNCYFFDSVFIKYYTPHPESIFQAGSWDYIPKYEKDRYIFTLELDLFFNNYRTKEKLKAPYYNFQDNMHLNVDEHHAIYEFFKASLR